MSSVGWEVDDRAASLRARAYLAFLRLHRDERAFEGEVHTRRIARKRQAKGDRPPTLLTRLRHSATASEWAGLTVWTVGLRRTRPRVRVLYLHGGGYLHPLTADYWRLVRWLARTPAEVVVPAYPLAPDATVDDAVPALVELATDLQDRDDRPLVLMGDSAGGALALVLARQLADLGHPPARVVALCPWLDATLDEAEVSGLEPTDPMLAESGLRAAGRWWAGRRAPTDPLVSPLCGELAGLPPLEVLIGDRDILRPAVDRLAALAEEQGASLQVLEVPAMFHVWMTRAIPEGRRTRRHLVERLRTVP
ncbi:MAG: alpha/beta hydrolase fold domain-containing protein [Nocardioides sp.]